MTCGGSDRGTCGCNGTCTCINGWSGSACDCTPMRSNCLDQSAVSLLWLCIINYIVMYVCVTKFAYMYVST